MDLASSGKVRRKRACMELRSWVICGASRQVGLGLGTITHPNQLMRSAKDFNLYKGDEYMYA